MMTFTFSRWREEFKSRETCSFAGKIPESGGSIEKRWRMSKCFLRRTPFSEKHPLHRMETIVYIQIIALAFNRMTSTHPTPRIRHQKNGALGSIIGLRCCKTNNIETTNISASLSNQRKRFFGSWMKCWFTMKKSNSWQKYIMCILCT